MSWKQTSAGGGNTVEIRHCCSLHLWSEMERLLEQTKFKGGCAKGECALSTLYLKET